MLLRHSLVVLAVGATWLVAQSKMNLQNLDPEAIDRDCKPCDDFYQYAIGKWHEKHAIPASQTRWGKRWAGADGNTEVLKTILDAHTNKAFAAGSNEQFLSDFYSSCMDTQTIDSHGANPLHPLLSRISSLKSRSQLQGLLEYLTKYGMKTPFALTSKPYSDDPGQTVAAVMMLTMGLPDPEYYLKDDSRSRATRQRYLQHIRTLMSLAGLQAEAAPAVLAMETRFAKEGLTGVQRRDPYQTNNYLSPEKLKEIAPHIDWASYSRASGTTLGNLTAVVDLRRLREVNGQLADASIEDWKAYLAFHTVRQMARDLSEPFQEEMFQFVDKHLGGQSERRPRWKYCVQRTDALLGDALGRAYVEKVFPPQAKARMQEMVKYLLAAMKDSIEDLDWMSPETKKQALAKLATFNPKVGYPDRWKSYTNLRIQRGKHAENVLQAIASGRRDDISRAGKPTDRTRWLMTAPTSNAYYDASMNEIVFPAGILLPPMFSASADDAANYGGIGVIIGHEISHGFDDAGSQFDAQGRLRNWWKAEDRNRFIARADCVVNQFENYFIEPGVHHNGKLVLGESIGDLAGARIAYRAYMKSLQGKPKTPSSDGLTPEQRFFLAWGQARGDSARLEQQRLMVVTDPHPVAKYRVIGPLSNMPEFQQAFECKEGDAMVRSGDKQCRIW